MGKINVLSFEIANLIAAGEVVERPSSVLKELIENSIDAGATEIIAEIKHGGVSLIRVSDNGCGIDKEDLPVSLKRHATSKIRERDDLAAIMTLGFRGEALAAISSVSEVTIITKTREADTAYMLTSEGGRVIDISEVGASDGTTVVVENLFFNVPARRKFLKKDATEAQNVAALVEKIALSRPDISIQLLIDGEERFKTPRDGELLNTIRAIFGREFSTKMLYAEGIADGVKVKGYIGRSDNVRKNRNLENVFVNGRYVKSLTAQAAIEKAYTSFIATEHFPACVLFIEMNPGTVDVNVHPAKLEVKFSDERRVFEAVYYTVKRALEEGEYRPEMSLGKGKSEYDPRGAFVPIGEDTRGKQISFGASDVYSQPVRTPTSQTERASFSQGSSSASYNTAPRSAGTNYGASRTALDTHSTLDRPLSVASRSVLSGADTMGAKESVDLLARYQKAPVMQTETETTVVNAAAPSAAFGVANAETEPEAIPEYKYVGEAFDCYLIIERDGELLIIDKHAAHERIIFEDLKRGRMQDNRIGSQGLMLPITVLLTPDEHSALTECTEEMRALGFDFTVSDRSADITAIPDTISHTDAEGLFVSMLGELSAGEGNPEITDLIRRERALYQLACKAAIKGGRIYDRSVTDWIIGKVLLLPDITVCPHGRPIAYKLKKSELDRQFERIK